LIYVDDILAIVDNKEKLDLNELLIGMFGTVQYEVGDELSCLGMQVSVGEHSATIDMSSYVQNIIKDITVKEEMSPGTKLSFRVDITSPKLTEAERKDFHSVTAKVALLGKKGKARHFDHGMFLMHKSERGYTR
jgi:hypothetical protein